MCTHIHAALMVEYAKDALETETPWERWETGKDGYPWKNLLQHPDWNIHNLYRRKPVALCQVEGRDVFPGDKLWHVEQGWLDRGKAALAECRAADDLWSDDRLLSHLFNAITAGWQSKASRDVLAERRRQVESEGWTPEHDDAHGDGSMCMAAVCYAEWDHYERPNSDGLIPINWPWSAKWWKPRDRRRNLVKAAALLLAEIERLDRTSTAAPEPSK